jgi:FHA domain
MLIGIGLFGAIEDAKGRRTHQVDDDSDIGAMQSLLDRVWPVEKSDLSRNSWITLGQDHDNDIVVVEYTLSAHHCAFGWENERLALADLGSLNGTKVSGRRLRPKEPVRLVDGLTLAMGRLQVMCFTPDGFTRHVYANSETGRAKARAAAEAAARAAEEQAATADGGGRSQRAGARQGRTTGVRSRATGGTRRRDTAAANAGARRGTRRTR